MSSQEENWVADRLRRDAKLLVAAKLGFVGQNERDVVVLDSARGVLVVLEVKSWSWAAMVDTKKSEHEWEVRGAGRPSATLINVSALGTGRNPRSVPARRTADWPGIWGSSMVTGPARHASLHWLSSR